MARTMTESLENYLKTILMLKDRRGVVRACDVAEALGFSRPSVSVAVKVMRREGLVAVDANNFLELTEEGLHRAGIIRDRYESITRVLSESLGLDPTSAQAYACRMEHILPEEVVSRLKAKTSTDQQYKKEANQ